MFKITPFRASLVAALAFAVYMASNDQPSSVQQRQRRQSQTMIGDLVIKADRPCDSALADPINKRYYVTTINDGKVTVAGHDDKFKQVWSQTLQSGYLCTWANAETDFKQDVYVFARCHEGGIHYGRFRATDGTVVTTSVLPATVRIGGYDANAQNHILIDRIVGGAQNATHKPWVHAMRRMSLDAVIAGAYSETFGYEYEAPHNWELMEYTQITTGATKDDIVVSALAKKHNVPNRSLMYQLNADGTKKWEKEVTLRSKQSVMHNVFNGRMDVVATLTNALVVNQLNDGGAYGPSTSPANYFRVVNIGGTKWALGYYDYKLDYVAVIPLQPGTMSLQDLNNRQIQENKDQDKKPNAAVSDKMVGGWLAVAATCLASFFF